MNKLILFSTALLILSGCSGNKAKDETAVSDQVSENVQSGDLRLHGNWRLASYKLDDESTQFGDDSKYTLSIDAPANAFGMSTDCNHIGGEFDMANDTIHFRALFVTEMAGDKMIVEENMLRLLNDSTAYAVFNGADTIILTSPGIGVAQFIRESDSTDEVAN